MPGFLDGAPGQLGNSRSPSKRDKIGRIQSGGLVMGGVTGGSSKAPLSRAPQGAGVQASPPRVACDRRSTSGGGSRVSGQAHPTGAGRLDA